MTDPRPTGAEKRFLTPKELAAELRLSPNSIYRLVEQRAIRFYRVSGSLRFAREDVEAFIRQGCVESVDKMKMRL